MAVEVLRLKPTPKSACAHPSLHAISAWPHNGRSVPRIYQCDDCKAVSQARVFETLSWERTTGTVEEWTRTGYKVREVV